MTSLKTNLLLFAVISSGVLSSCSTIHTERQELNASASGFTYAMPVRYAKLSFKRDIQVVDSLSKMSQIYVNKKAERDSLVKLHDDTEKLYSETRKFYELAENNGINTEVLSELQMAKLTTQFSLANISKKKAKAEKEFKEIAEKFKLASEGTTNPKEWGLKEPVDKLTVELLPVSADPGLKFSTKFPHSVLRNEHHFLKINENGLLQSADIETEDQTSSILTGVAGAISVASVGGGYTGMADFSPSSARFFTNNRLLNLDTSSNTREGFLSFNSINHNSEVLLQAKFLTSLAKHIYEAVKDEESSTDCNTNNGDSKFWTKEDQLGLSETYEDLSHETVLDPVDYGSVAVFNRKLCSMGSNLRFAVSRPSSPDGLVSINAAHKEPACAKDGHLCEGIVYRRLQPIQLAVEQIIQPDKKSIMRIRKEAKMEQIPNASPLDYVEDSSSLFSASTSNMKFINGVLTEYHVERPSEINEMAQATYDVMLAPFKAVSEVVSFQVKSGQGKAALAQSAYDIEKLRLDALENENTLEKNLLTTSIEIEQQQALRDAELQLAILQGDTNLQGELATQRANAAAIETAAFDAEVTAINRTSRLTEAELDSAINILKKRKELLELQKELDELSKTDE